MVEIERNPLAVRQGAAAVACIAAAAVAMPVIAHRAAEQREGGDVQMTSLDTRIGGDLFARGADQATVQLALARTEDGFRGRGLAANDPRALLVQAALRGPLPDSGAQAQKALNPRELRCMSEAIYYEARGETQRGQLAVGEVVMNRVRSGYYPSSICGVVYQGSSRATGCQFTFTCDGSLSRRPKGAAWAQAQRVARVVMLGYARPVTARATHYHTTAVNPYWSSTLVEAGRVGQHVFYRFPNRTERALLARANGAKRRVPSEAALPQLAEEAAPPAPEIVTIEEAVARAAIAQPQPGRAREGQPVDILGPLRAPPVQPAAPVAPDAPDAAAPEIAADLGGDLPVAADTIEIVT
jgi:spore germination cell wall hydrolase CwlJ-like protein